MCLFTDQYRKNKDILCLYFQLSIILYCCQFKNNKNTSLVDVLRQGASEFLIVMTLLRLIVWF